MARLAFVILALCIGASLSAQWPPTRHPRTTTTRSPPPLNTTTAGHRTTTAGHQTTGQPGDAKLWALLVAGSNYYYNYRHQADVCHAYQILHAHGIPDENIIVMMYDDIANDDENPTKGVIINHPNGKDVYKGVLKDYTGKDVTPENFVNILTGNKAALKGIGSGRVIESGPNDHVFVNFVDHGATGILGFPDGELTVKQLTDALQTLHKNNRYNKLVLYVEACEAGSMFKDVLPSNINIFATTASDYDESSYACYYDSTRNTYLGDVYSVKWMEDSDAQDIEKETLDAQFETVKKETTTSHVMEYGDTTISKLVVGQFQGEKEAQPQVLPKIFEKGVSSYEVPLDILYRKLAAATTKQQKQDLQAKIDDMLEKRGHLETVYKKVVARVAKSHEHHETLLTARPQGMKNLDCHHQLVKTFSQHCFNLGKNPYAMKFAFVLANICEHGSDAAETAEAIKDVCKGVAINGFIH
jgi:legumain